MSELQAFHVMIRLRISIFAFLYMFINAIFVFVCFIGCNVISIVV